MDVRAIATSALGRDPGPLAPVSSRSHQVHVGADVVVKLIDADDHSRLDREIALARHLPPDLTDSLLASGHQRDVRYPCYTRALGAAPGMGLPGISEQAALDLARQAIERLETLHAWTPPEPAARILAEVLDHGGFTGRDALVAQTDSVAGSVPPNVLDGLKRIASRAPSHARNTVPVHTDCHWDNWLAHEGEVTALLDFEWARFGDPLDDWFFVARFSGPHMHAVLDTLAHATDIPLDVLRVECEVREASHLLADLPVDPPTVLNLLEQLVAGIWWTPELRTSAQHPRDRLRSHAIPGFAPAPVAARQQGVRRSGRRGSLPHRLRGTGPRQGEFVEKLASRTGCSRRWSRSATVNPRHRVNRRSAPAVTLFRTAQNAVQRSRTRRSAPHTESQLRNVTTSPDRVVVQSTHNERGAHAELTDSFASSSGGNDELTQRANGSLTVC